MKTSLTLSQKWPPLGGSGDACLLGLRAASGLGLGRRWQAGRQEGRLAKEEAGKKKRERHGTPGGSSGSPPRQLLGNWCSALQVGLSQLPAADIASSRNRQEEEEEEEEERVWR